MGCSDGTLEDQMAKLIMKKRGLAHEASEGKQPIKNGHILRRNLTIFCLYHEKLEKVKSKSYELMWLVEKVSRQESNQDVEQ